MTATPAVAAQPKLKFEMRVKGHPFDVRLVKLEVDSEEEAIAVARATILKMTVTRDSVGRIIVRPDTIKQVELMPVTEFS